MYNYLGQQKLVKKIEKVGSPIVEMNIANSQEGNYMIRIQSKGRRDLIKSIVIVH